MKTVKPAQNPAFVRLIEALAERLVTDHLTGKTAPERQIPKPRPKHVSLRNRPKAA